MTELVEQPAEQETAETDPAIPEKSSRLHGRSIAVLVIVALVVYAIDIISKQFVVAHLSDGRPVRLLGGALYLVFTRNSGAAFSLGTGYTWIFPLITLGVIGWIVFMASKLRSVPWAIALGLVLGGAFGNFTDRIFRAPGPLRGEVIDFLSFLSPTGRHFAIFNLADSALVCGVVLAILLELAGRRRDGSRVRN